VFQQVHKIPEEKIEFFPNCLDPWLAAAPLTPSGAWNKHWRLDKQRRYMVTLARLQPTEKEKGYDTIINLLPYLAKKHPDIAYLLAGKSEESEYARIRRLAEEKGVANRVMMPGYVAPEHLPALYSLAKVFVMPSAKEGFGIVYLEAAWWGCSVVAYNAGGAKEALLDGQLGTLVPAGNEKDLLQALDSKISEPPMTDLERDRLREKIDHHYGFGVFCLRLNQMLRTLGRT
jgi:glycosyltransferase involved in cell wall biosynthesis